MIYTREQWANDRTFNASPGQEIEEDIYNYMFNCMPIIDLTKEAITKASEYGLNIAYGFLMGEPHDCDKDGMTYLAFGKVRNNDETRYYYLGLSHARRR